MQLGRSQRPMALVSNYLAVSLRNYGSWCIGRAPSVQIRRRVYVTLSAAVSAHDADDYVSACCRAEADERCLYVPLASHTRH